MDEKHIVELFLRAAPLVESEMILRDWLARHGVVYGSVGQGWSCLDNRDGFQGMPIGERYTTFADMLRFALETAERNIREGVPPTTEPK